MFSKDCMTNAYNCTKYAIPITYTYVHQTFINPTYTLTRMCYQLMLIIKSIMIHVHVVVPSFLIFIRLHEYQC